MNHDRIFAADGNYTPLVLNQLKPVINAQFAIVTGVVSGKTPLSALWAEAREKAAGTGKLPLVREGYAPGHYKVVVPAGFRDGSTGSTSDYEVLVEREFLELMADRLGDPK